MDVPRKRRRLDSDGSESDEKPPKRIVKKQKAFVPLHDTHPLDAMDPLFVLALVAAAST